MGAPTPVAVGGTIGFLLRKEIEYFSKFELGNSQRPQPHYVYRPRFWVFLMTGKRRKRRDNNVFPSSGGMFPVSLLSETARYWRCFQVPYSEGIWPEIRNDCSSVCGRTRAKTRSRLLPHQMNLRENQVRL
ncbi:hypothetical protein V8G54_026744 [Vigna mungo]|uniref:Uncharacterized protein n=1 Tax=Vigna mungo TaxID=3915 RepID=A0AAQ3MZB0_VIGMU